MVRIVKDYDERLTEFLDVAQELFYSKGYEPTSVQEIIKTVGVAKGTFYHYFNSKAELLEVMIERMYEDVLAIIEPLTTDESLTPIDKLERIFAYSNNWKLDNRDLMIDTVRVMYADKNVLLRDKMRKEAIRIVVPILGKVIQEGMDAQIFDVEYPFATAELMLTMSETLSTSAVSVLLAKDYSDADIEHVKRQIMVYNRSIERILSLEKGTLTLLEPDMMDSWFED